MNFEQMKRGVLLVSRRLLSRAAGQAAEAGARNGVTRAGQQQHATKGAVMEFEIEVPDMYVRRAHASGTLRAETCVYRVCLIALACLQNQTQTEGPAATELKVQKVAGMVQEVSTV
jgi:hypothetical protein